MQTREELSIYLPQTSPRKLKAMTIHLRVELMPFLSRKQDKIIYDMKMPDDSTVEGVLSELGFEDEQMGCLIISVNDKHVYLEKKLKDNDAISIGMAIGCARVLFKNLIFPDMDIE